MWTTPFADLTLPVSIHRPTATWFWMINVIRIVPTIFVLFASTFFAILFFPRPDVFRLVYISLSLSVCSISAKKAQYDGCYSNDMVCLSRVAFKPCCIQTGFVVFLVVFTLCSTVWNGKILGQSSEAESSLQSGPRALPQKCRSWKLVKVRGDVNIVLFIILF